MTTAEEQRLTGDVEIQDVSAWILRVGVVVSVAVMVLGLALSLWQGRPSVDQMQRLHFSTDFAWVVHGSLALDGVALIEAGILLLVLTPIMRVATSMVLFATAERDWFYACVTLVVFALTLLSLLILR